jgi:hypothetical protein
VTPTGLEPNAVTTIQDNDLRRQALLSAARSGADSREFGHLAAIEDQQLAMLIERWAILTLATQQAIIQLIESDAVKNT